MNVKRIEGIAVNIIWKEKDNNQKIGIKQESLKKRFFVNCVEIQSMLFVKVKDFVCVVIEKFKNVVLFKQMVIQTQKVVIIVGFIEKLQRVN